MAALVPALHANRNRIPKAKSLPAPHAPHQILTSRLLSRIPKWIPAHNRLRVRNLIPRPRHLRHHQWQDSRRVNRRRWTLNTLSAAFVVIESGTGETLFRFFCVSLTHLIAHRSVVFKNAHYNVFKECRSRSIGTGVHKNGRQSKASRPRRLGKRWCW